MFIQFLFLLIYISIVKFEKNDQLNTNVLQSDNFLTKYKNESKEILPNIYEQLLKQISTYCISDKEYEELYQNKLKAGLVSSFFPFLVDGATKQIGFNELRQKLNLKKQKINFNNIIEEEYNEENKNNTKIELNYFKNKVYYYSMNKAFKYQFWPEDVQNTEKFLDKIYPQIRQLFKLKYEEIFKDNEIEEFNKQTIDQIFKQFISMSYKIYEAIGKSNTQSTSVLLFWIFKVNCSDPKFAEFNKII